MIFKIIFPLKFRFKALQKCFKFGRKTVKLLHNKVIIVNNILYYKLQSY